MMANEKFRRYCAMRGVRIWELCEKVKISESSMTRLLRRELDEETAEHYTAIVDEIAQERMEKKL